MIRETFLGGATIVYRTFEMDGLDVVQVLEATKNGEVIELSISKVQRIVLALQEILAIENRIRSIIYKTEEGI